MATNCYYTNVSGFNTIFLVSTHRLNGLSWSLG